MSMCPLMAPSVLNLVVLHWGTWRTSDSMKKDLIYLVLHKMNSNCYPTTDLEGSLDSGVIRAISVQRGFTCNTWLATQSRSMCTPTLCLNSSHRVAKVMTHPTP